jgi:hypothetical protein
MQLVVPERYQTNSFMELVSVSDDAERLKARLVGACTSGRVLFHFFA